MMLTIDNEEVIRIFRYIDNLNPSGRKQLREFVQVDRLHAALCIIKEARDFATNYPEQLEPEAEETK